MNTATRMPPMMVNRFKVGDRVKSRAGWTGTVTKVRELSSGRDYRVRWDQNGHEGRMSPLELFPA